MFVVLLWTSVLVPSGRGQGVQVRVSAGGTGRFQRGHWGLVKANLVNSTDHDREVLAVAIPAFSRGMQYGRRVVIPAGTTRSCQWPVQIPDDPAKSFEFEFLVFDDPDDESSIKRTHGETVTQSFAVVNSEHLSSRPAGYRGLLSSDDETARDAESLRELAEILRQKAGLAPMELLVQEEQLAGYPEALEPLEQLVITSQTLHRFPEACDAVRVWTQRGGRTWVLLDQCGMPSAAALLGDTLPLTEIDETSSNTMTFVASPRDGQPTPATVSREFDEPVRLVRVIAEAGTVRWTVDGWPAVIELPYGDGTIMLTMVSPEVFLERTPTRQFLPMAQDISNRLFDVAAAVPRVSSEQLGAAAAGSIGYQVPSRFFAGSVMFGFAVALSLCGITLLRNDRAMTLLWGVPALACLCALPAVWVGGRSRNVAPPTAIQQQVSNLAAGQTTLAADGVTSVFQPSPGPLNVTMSDYALLTPVNPDQDRGERRLVWTDVGESSWQKLHQDAGIRDYAARSVQRLPEPEQVWFTFDQTGLVGQFRDPTLAGRSDLVLAGTSADRMAVRQTSDGTLVSTPDNVLAGSEFVTGTLLSDTQKRRSAVYRAMFETEKKNSAYPDQLMLFSWIDQQQSSIRVGDEATRQAGSVLLSQNVELLPPTANTDITIPPVLLPYRTVVDDLGGLSSAFDNRQRTWAPRNMASTTWVKFSVPQVCQPFAASGGTLAIRLHAGSRQVKVSAGARDNAAALSTMDSPAGLFTLRLESQHLQDIAMSGAFFVRLDVSDLQTTEDEDSDITRDDYWKIERMLLTLDGQRREP
ncbi:MAG: hypothetical protein R3C59_23000 [Planctomycetaceae bacterium]